MFVGGPVEGQGGWLTPSGWKGLQLDRACRCWQSAPSMGVPGVEAKGGGHVETCGLDGARPQSSGPGAQLFRGSRPRVLITSPPAWTLTLAGAPGLLPGRTYSDTQSRLSVLGHLKFPRWHVPASWQGEHLWSFSSQITAVTAKACVLVSGLRHPERHLRQFAEQARAE